VRTHRPASSGALRRLTTTRGFAAGAWGLAALLGLSALAGEPGVSRDEAAVLAAAEGSGSASVSAPPLAPLLSRATLAAGSRAGLGHLRSFRLGSALAGALLSALLAALAWELAGRATALLAPAFFWLAPRHLHAGLVAAPDLLVAALSVATVLAYRRASTGPGGRGRFGFALLAGLSFGGALCARTGAWVLLPALALHAALAHVVDRRRGLAGAPAARPSRGALLAMVLLGPAILLAAWPGVLRAGAGAWLSTEPFAPFAALLPILAVPASILWAYAGGCAHAAIRLSRAFRGRAPTALVSDELLLLVAALAPLGALALSPSPSGAQAFLPAAPFLALLAARGLLAAAREAWPARAAPLAASAALLVLYPGLRASAHLHPLEGSAWNELVGGLPGAASLDLERQQGGEAAAGLLAIVNERALPGARIWWASTDASAVRAYVRDGRLRSDLALAGDPEAADLAVVTVDGGGRGRDDEYRAWTAFRTSRPAAGFYLDEVPLAFVYARPGAWR